MAEVLEWSDLKLRNPDIVLCFITFYLADVFREKGEKNIKKAFLIPYQQSKISRLMLRFKTLLSRKNDICHTSLT